MKPDFETLKSIVTSTITIGIITGIVYIAGIFYDGGFLETLNIESSLFPRSFEDHIFTGGLTLFTNHMRIFFYIALALSAPYFLMFIAWEAKDSRIVKSLLEKPGIQPAAPLEHHVRLQELRKKALYIFALGFFLIAFILITASTLVSSYNSGVSDAEKRSLEQNQKPEIFNSKVFLVNGKEISGHIVRCSESRCAFLNKNSIVILPTSEISKIEAPTKSTTDRNI